MHLRNVIYPPPKGRNRQKRQTLHQETFMDTQLKTLNHIRRDIVASAVLYEAGRLADSRQKGARILPGDIYYAFQDFMNTLSHLQKQGV
jgi:hypothetical protein